MPLIYLEDILEHGENKYIAVNVAAKRAREINAENSLPMLIPNAEKPVTVAIDELKSGRIGYEELDRPDAPLDDSPFGSRDTEEDKEVEGLEETPPITEEHYEEGNVTDPDEMEEGL